MLRFKLPRLTYAKWFALTMVGAACGDSTGTAPGDAPAVAQVVVQPETKELLEGGTHTFTASVLDASGKPITGRTVTWSSSDNAVTSVDANGRATAIAAGDAFVRADVDGKRGTAQVTVLAASVDRVELSAAALSMSEGESQVVTAVVKDAAGRVLQGRTIAWSSGDPSSASIDAGGRITAVREGRATISARVEGREATLEVTVQRAAVASVAVTPAGMVLEIGESRQLTAVLKDALGTVLVDRTVRWSVDNGAATISPNGMITGVAGGYVTAMATSEGVTGAVAGTVVRAESYDYDLVYHRATNNGDSELLVMTVGDGTAPLRLNAGSVSRSASPSPNGQRLAFAVSMELIPTRERVDDIFAVDRTGLNMKRLTLAEGQEDQPAWSPTGGRIAYHVMSPDERSDIWIMNEDGTGQLNLTAEMPAHGARSAPAWSWDGTRLAFAQLESGIGGTTASIWTMRPDGSDKRQVTSTLTGFDAMPTWSADGTQIAFVRYYAGDADITVVTLATGVTQRIAIGGLQASPAWSPNGQFLAFTQDAGLVTNIYTIRPDGSHLRLRTVNPAWGGGLDPAWIRHN